MFCLESSNSKLNVIIQTDSYSLIKDIKQRVCYYVENLGIRPPWDKITIKFISSDEMNKRNPNAAGLCYSNHEGTYDIYIRCGYSYLYTKSVLAHEIGHSWISENRIRVNKIENEGFCQLLAYQILYSDFNPHSNNEIIALSEWKNEVYGDGFRLMKSKLDSLGWQQLLLFMQVAF